MEMVWGVLREMVVGAAMAALTFTIEFLFHRVMKALSFIG